MPTSARRVHPIARTLIRSQVGRETPLPFTAQTMGGKYILLFYSGVKDEEGIYKNGKKEGEWNSWYANKIKRKKLFYKNSC